MNEMYFFFRQRSMILPQEQAPHQGQAPRERRSVKLKKLNSINSSRWKKSRQLGKMACSSSSSRRSSSQNAVRCLRLQTPRERRSVKHKNPNRRFRQLSNKKVSSSSSSRSSSRNPVSSSSSSSRSSSQNPVSSSSRNPVRCLRLTKR